MSYAAERWARSQVAGNARAKAVLIELAHCLNGRTGQCTPSVAYLSRVTELKPDTITKATNDLQDRGLITKTVIKTKSGRSCSYRLIGFVHSEWDIHENEDIPENGGIPDSAGTHTPENVVTGNPKNGVTHTPENGDRTGNKNREIEQVIETHEDAASESTPPKTRAKKGEAWKKWIKVEKPDEVSDDLWKQFGEIRALKKMALTARALELLRSEGEKAHMTLHQVVETCCGNGWAGFKASWLTKVNVNNYRKPQNVTQTAEYRERLQACCRGEGRNEKLADDGVTIIVD